VDGCSVARPQVVRLSAEREEPITIADLVDATGVAGRTLFMHLKEFKALASSKRSASARAAARIR
jgi:hypothetical protein